MSKTSSSLGSIDQHIQVVERRVSIRFASDEDALCHLGGARSECRWVRVQDVSATGVGLNLDSTLQVGKRLTLEFPEVGSGLRRTLRAHVIHCTARDDGTWLVGCRFDSPPAGQDLRGLAAQVG
jgi:hypothetical protein